MQTFDSITAARDALMDYPVTGIPEAKRDQFRQLRSSPSPVDQIVGIGELLYANREQLDDAGKDLAAGLVSYASMNGWHGLATDARGDGIVQALRRDLGDKPTPGLKFPKPADDPAPKAEYVAEPEAAPES